MNEAALTIPEIELPSVHLVARNPNEMALAKTSIEMFLSQKIKQCDTEADDLGQSAQIARQRKWAHATLDRHCNLAKRRGDFYRKALTAVQAGYTIVPNFPIDMFAVRVKRSTPLRDQSVSTYSQSHAISSASDIQSAALPVGEGNYVSPSPMGRTGSYQEKKKDNTEITKYFFTTTDYQDIAFPIEAARAEVMSASAEAMALRCFDAIGICPQSRKGDPLIIGQILGPKIGYKQKTISFLIAWHLDLRTL